MCDTWRIFHDFSMGMRKNNSVLATTLIGDCCLIFISPTILYPSLSRLVLVSGSQSGSASEAGVGKR